MAFRLIPREERFYDDFVRMAEQIRVGAALLEEMLVPDRPIWDKADEIKEVEHKCDFLTHEIIQRLQPDVRDAARSRGHPRAGPLARRRDGRDRRVAAIVRLYRLDSVGPARAQLRTSSRLAEQVVSRWRRSNSARASPRRRRDQPARERGRSRHQEAISRCSRTSATRSRSSSGRRSRLPRGRHRPLRGRRQRPRRRRRQARLSPSDGRQSARRRRADPVALVFDFINGFHDAANSIATVVSTRVLTPGQGGRLGRVLQLRRRVRLRHRGRQDRRRRAWSTSTSSPSR